MSIAWLGGGSSLQDVLLWILHRLLSSSITLCSCFVTSCWLRNRLDWPEKVSSDDRVRATSFLRWDACACVTNFYFLGSGYSTHLMCFWRNSSSRTPLQSKTEKQLVTSAAIAYGVYPLIQRVSMPISTSKTSRSRSEATRTNVRGAKVGEVISRLSRAGMSLFPHFWTKDSSYKGPWSMIPSALVC